MASVARPPPPTDACRVRIDEHVVTEGKARSRGLLWEERIGARINLKPCQDSLPPRRVRDAMCAGGEHYLELYEVPYTPVAFFVRCGDTPETGARIHPDGPSWSGQCGLPRG